jgi:hypothetical protein
MKKIIVSIIIIIVLIIGSLSLYKHFVQKPQTALVGVSTSTVPVQQQTEDIKNTTSSVSTPINESTQKVVADKVPDVKPEIKQTVAPSVKTSKNIYAHKSAGYSITIPDGWVGKTVDTGISEVYSTNFSDPTGKVTIDDVAFSASATGRAFQDDAYFKSYSKKPTNEDLVDMFIADQKDNAEMQWALKDKTAIVINGTKGYVLTATFGNSDVPTYVTAKYYLLFGTNYIYNISLNYKTSNAPSEFAQYKPYVLTFVAK